MTDCADPPCAISGNCQLKHLLDGAGDAFFAALDGHTLANALASPKGEAIVSLHVLHAGRIGARYRVGAV